MNKKGQALVEFVLILPIFLFLLFAIYDFAVISKNQNKLENDSVDIILLYKNGVTLDEIINKFDNIDISVTNDDKYDKVIVTRQVKLITPGFNRIFGNPYKIKVERYIVHEQ